MAGDLCARKLIYTLAVSFLIYLGECDLRDLCAHFD